MLTRAERDALIESHLAFATRLADQIRRELPKWISADDLASAATEGLVEAAARFDPSRGVRFTTFAYYRIRGAVYDHARGTSGQDPVQRARMAAQAAADDLVERSMDARRVTEAGGSDAVAAMAAETLAMVLEDVATAMFVGEIAALTAAEPVGADPEATVAEAQTAAWVREVVGHLPERERTVVEGVYLRGLTIEQAGATMGLSKAWSSRLHARALALLRHRITAARRDP